MWTMFLVFFAVAVAYLIIIANGYKVNWQTMNFEETGIIYLNPDPSDCEIYLNGKLQNNKRPLIIKDLFPGYYDIKITKENYQDWEKTLRVKSGMVASEKKIKLWLKNPEIAVLDENESALWKNRFAEQSSIATDIQITDNELWRDKDLITRFSQPIKSALWFPDRDYLLVQLGQEVRAISADGLLDQKLFSLSSDEPGLFSIQSSADEIIYRDGVDFKRAKIR